MSKEAAVILALDTTSEYGSVALRRGGETVGARHLTSPDGFAHVIFHAIEDLLREVKVGLEEIDCFAAASGPGSFTGVRVSLAAVKGLAEALGKPAAAISNLRALSLFGRAELRAVVLDARRGEVYGAVYNAAGRAVVEEMVAPWEAWLRAAPAGAEFIGWEDGPCQTAGLAFTAVPKWLAAAVAECAAADGPGAWSDPAALDANYVRRADAELFWKDDNASRR